jgi:N,N'-diacetyllegionaminate synthase
MNCNFEIFDRIITNNSPTLIIAEVGINHLGSEDLCADMILAAIKSGADCIKLQTGNLEESFHPNSTSYEAFKGCELSKEALINLSKLTNDNGSYLFSSPGDFSSVEMLREINSKAYKVSSGQFTNIPIIQEMIKDDIPIIFSTGMAKEEEIKKIVNLCDEKNLSNYAFLHCVSIYPALYGHLNLDYIKHLNKNYNIISGYSDHTIGDLACLAAVAMGAKIIEKHFTTDNNLKGADNKLSMNKDDFKKMCLKIRNIESMKYESLLKPHPNELNLRQSRYRKIIAKKDITKGESFTLDNVNFMRIEDDLNCTYASDWHLVSGKVSKNFVKKNSLITKDSY